MSAKQDSLTSRIEALPERQRALLALCLDGGCDLVMAGEALEMSAGEARGELTSALRTLEMGWEALRGQWRARESGSLKAPASLGEALDVMLPGATCETIVADVQAGLAWRELVRERRSTIGTWRRWIPAAAALVALGLFGFGAIYFRKSNEALGARVESGRVKFKGAEAAFVPNGERAENAGNSPAVLRLADGTRVTLEPATVLRANGKAGEGMAVEVERGGASFVCGERGKGLSVKTPVGEVTAASGTFSVDLQKRDNQIEEGDNEMNKNLMAMTLAVVAGTVSVRFDGNDFLISAGGSRVFAAEGDKVVKGDAPVKGEKVDKGEKATEVALEDVPSGVKAAADAMVPGITLSSARSNGAGTEYYLDGASGGIEYEVRVSAYRRKVKGGGDKKEGTPKIKDKGNPDGDVRKPVKGGEEGAPPKVKDKPKGEAEPVNPKKPSKEGGEGGEGKPNKGDKTKGEVDPDAKKPTKEAAKGDEKFNAKSPARGDKKFNSKEQPESEGTQF